MPLQYLHTSAKRGLEPGKSGFCCVARDRELPVDLARELERLSRYEHISGKSNPIILRHLQVSTRSGNYHVLSRLRDAGNDYSKRNNHIAHHLAFTQDEAISLPDPATILLFWKGWKDAWLEPPRVLGARDGFEIHNLNTSPDSINPKFNSLVSEGVSTSQALQIAEGQENDLALHYRNELLKLPVSKRWDIPFTNFILVSDRPPLFQWSANWKGRALPFEHVASPIAPQKTIKKPPEPAHPSTPQAAPEKTATTASAQFSKNAPTVEIPEELSRSARRRPKRKWTHKRFTNTLNLGLGAMGLVCVGVILYLLYDYKSPTIPTPYIAPEPEVPITTEIVVQQPLDIRGQWDQLAQSNQLLENSDEAMRLAVHLADQGDPIPLQLATVLQNANQPPANSLEITLGPNLVQKAEEYWELNPILDNELAKNSFALLPQSLSDRLAILTAQSNPPDRVYERLVHNRFLPEDAEMGLKALRRNAKDQLAKQSIESITPAEDYLDLWQTLSNDNRLEPISEIETAFGISPLTGFFAIDERGMLLSPDKTDITQHLVQLYEHFLLPRFSSFGNAPEFREALQGANGDFDSTIEAARAIHEVLITAQPQSANLQNRLQKIRDQWHETFIRNDLMKETMINFNFERLANSKLELAQLQSQFDHQTLFGLRSLDAILDTINTAEQSLSQIDDRTTWTLLRRTSE